MSRPKRIASLKAKQNLDVNKSGNDLDLSEESDGDFSSASSDEYNPISSNKGKNETFEDSEDYESSESGSEQVSESSPEKIQQKTSRGNLNKVSTLRGSVSNKFKRHSSRGSLQGILQRAQFQKKKSVFDNGEKPPDFDCSGGVQLSGSSDSDGEGTSSQSKQTKQTSKLISNINESSSGTMVDLNSVHENYQRIENAKAQLSNYKNTNGNSQKENVNIADLLALGEGPSSPAKKSKRVRKEDSDSDGWEEVEDDGAGSYKIPKQGVEIIFGNGNENQRKKEDKIVDIEAQMKRKLNRNRKEFQVNLHKVNVIAWIAHGNYVNQKINNSDLMAAALKLLPKNNNHCYPTDQTDVDYFKQVTNWFISTIQLNNQNMYSILKKRPPLMTSLALQIKLKTAICRRDYVLIFIILLRGLGIQCRMVQSLNCAPIMPNKSDLLSLAKKPEEKSSSSKSKSSSSKSKSSSNKTESSSSKSKSSSSKSKSSSSKSTSSSSKSELNLDKSEARSSRSKSSSSRSNSSKRSKDKKKEIEIPQLDGGDDLPRGSRRNIKLKALPGFKVEESFVDLNKEDTPEHKQKHSNTRSSKGEGSSTSKLECSFNSPNRMKSPSEKLFKSNDKKNLIKKLNPVAVSSPRKTRSKEKSKSTNNSEENKEKLKDTLQVLSPRRLRSRSRSNEGEISKDSTSKEDLKPNLKKLNDRKRPSSSKEEIGASKKSKSAGIKRKAEETAVKAEDSDDSTKCFKFPPIRSFPSASTSAVVDRRILSSDDEADVSATKSPSKSKRIDIWVEVYSEKDKKWLSIDIMKNKVDCVTDICKTATQPVVYVFAWNNDNSLKDVSARYCPNLNTTTRKLRVEQSYLLSIVKQFEGQKTVRDVKEDDELNMLQLATPMPTSIALFKNHPLYALERHLLQYEALYPAEPPILGYIREEAVYPRDCVFVLHTRETWLKEARVVKLHELPYKIRKSIKWDNTTRKLLRDIPQELFGIWQTNDFEPPVAKDGLVPRNAYGNVELFKPCMLPKGTVHLNLPGLNKVCKKIGVDCSVAITGFDSNGGWPYPVYDGFVVCAEFEEKVMDAWNREQEEIERKEAEKYEKRVYGNWKKLIKGLMIRERLKRKYNFELQGEKQ